MPYYDYVPENIIEKLHLLPQSPGCYIMKDCEGKVLYVGKAKILPNRVKSYFTDSFEKSPRIMKMVGLVRNFDYVVTGSEQEALVLESSLIKKYSPPFNILLKDDKSYPYICITDDEYPYIKFARKLRFKKDDRNRYFGPYTDINAVKDTLKLIRQIFRVPCGHRHPENSRGRACLYYHINQCLGVCCNHSDKIEYNNAVNDVIKFLDGDRKELIRELTDRMSDYAENMEYEKAAKVRDQINAVNRLVNRQQVVSEAYDDKDVIAIYSDGYSTVAFVLNVREGYVSGQNNIKLDNTDPDNMEKSMYEFMISYYNLTHHIPKEILVNILPEDTENLCSWLSDKKGKKVTIMQPMRGEKKKLLDLTLNNAEEQVGYQTKKASLDSEIAQKALNELQDAIDSEIYPERMECYDISNIQGTNTVSSLVTFIGGKPAKDYYRKFKLETTEGKPDDFKSMRETILRRFTGSLSKTEKFSQYPDLLIIDGGMGQLSSVVSVLEELNIKLPVISLAKREEFIYKPYSDVPIALPRRSEALMMLQRIRDEAHRFAITYHKNLRGKTMSASVLNKIEGVGPSRRKELLKHFGSVEKIKSATREELAEVKGMTQPVAENIYVYFHREEL
ncbi:MAG: excinuclease ABC subunit UvrC [Armatimonadetes bacterium]|nr:excinuclease ABC subunit UvrC [Candidatus Hippobium faecium]